MNSAVSLISLGKIIRVSKGKKPKFISFRALDDTYLPYILIESFDGQYNQFTNDKTCRLVSVSDIEIVWDGERSGLVSKGHKGYLGSTLASISLVDESFDSDFIFYILQQSQKLLRQGAEGTGVPHLSRWVLENVSICKLPLPEQKKIASILTSIDDVIEKTEAQIAKLQDLKTGMMNELLTNGIGHTEFKESELGRIPKDWEICTLGEILTLEYGKSPKNVTEKSGIFPIYGTGILHRKSSNYLYDGESIIVGRKGTIGRVQYVSGKFWAIDTVFFAKVNTAIAAKWIYYFLAQLNLSRFNESTGVPSLSRQTLYHIALAIPPLPEQKKIASILTSVDDNIEEKQRKLEHTQSLKKSLMQGLLTGKVRVEVA